MPRSREVKPTATDTARLQKEFDRLKAECKALQVELEERGVACEPAAEAGRRASTPAAFYKQIAAILDISADAIISVDGRGMVRRFNRGAEDVFGYRSSEIIGRPLDVLIPERYRKAHRAHMATFAHSGEDSRLMNARGEINGLRRDGTEFPAEASIARLETDGRPVYTVILRDVTERAKAEAAVRDSEALLKAVLDNLPAAVHLKDIDGRYILVNKEYERAFGWSNDKARGLTIGEMHAGAVVEDTEKHDRRVLETLRTQTGEILFESNDSVRTHLAVKSPLFDEAGNPTAILCVETDITERKRAEAELRHAQTMARIGAFVWDEVADVCVHCSEEMAALFGMSAAEFMANRGTTASFQEFVHPEDRDKFIKVMDQTTGSSVPYDLEYRCYDARGELRYFREMGEPVLDDDGRHIRTFGTMQDRTDIRRAEEALRQSEQQLRLIADNLPAFVAYTDKDQHLRFANKTAGDWYGGRPEDLIGKTARELIGDELFEQVASRFEAVLSGKSVRVEEHRTFPDGKTRYVDAANIPDFDSKGQVRGWFSLIHDITDRKRNEDALRQSEEQLRLITDNLPVFISYMDSGQRFRFVNKAVERWYSRPASEIIGRTAREIVGAGSYAAIENGLNTVLSGEPVQFEFSREFQDGMLRTVDVTYVPDRDPQGLTRGCFALLQDVTERKQAEDAVRNREQQLRTVTDSIPAFVVYVDKNLRYLYANRVAEQWYDRPAAEIIGKQVSDILDEESLEIMMPPLDRVLAGENVRFETNRSYPDGSQRSIDVSFAPHVIDGEVQGFFGVILDVSESRQAQESLRRTLHSGELLRRIATAANETSSAEDAFAVGLKAFCEFGGWDVGDVFVLADDDSGAMIPAGLWWSENPRDFSKLRKATMETRFVPGAGLPGRIAESGQPEWIPDVTKDANFPRARTVRNIGVRSGFGFPVLVGRKVEAVLEFFCREDREPDHDLIDMSIQAGIILGRVIERHRAARNQSEREQQLRLITDNLPVLVAYIDSDWRFRFANREAEAWYARPSAELIGKDLADFFSPEIFERARPRIEGALKGEKQTFEAVLEYPDGKTRSVEANYLPHFDNHGKVGGFFALVVDVTERIQKEEELRHAQRMEAVGKLTGGVAHEFNNQLAVIIGSTELLRDSPDNIDSAVDAIGRAAVRGSELTQRLLSFSRQQPLRPAVVDLSALILDMSGMLSRMLGETVKVEVAKGRKNWPARVDKGQLENAILNVAINAQHAMQRGGTLTLGVRNAKLGAAGAAKRENVAPGDYIVLTMADTGAGMPSDVLEHAFEPFFTTKEIGEGSGLGLSMVYGFASQSGGFVEIESDEGKGTTVKIHLPRANGAKKPAVAKPREEKISAGAGGSVLVVEDDPDVRRLTVTLLSSLGYTVLEAEDGEHAIPLLEGNEDIDLLLSDVVLPGDQTGPAIAEAGTRIRPNLKVLFMSGYAEDVIRREQEGGQRSIDADLLSKPFTRAELARKVRTTLETAKSAGG